MSVDLINYGNGAILEDSIIGWSYSEEVTSIHPGDVKGGTGQVTVRAIEQTADKVGNTHPNSKLMINNAATLVESDLGQLSLQVKKVSANGGAVTISADTELWRLNAIRTADPHGGTGATLMTAILDYCDLVNIVPSFDGTLADELDAIPVNFVGWTGNVWEYLKMLCSAVSASGSVTQPIEMYIAPDGLHFRKALQTEAIATDLDVDYSIDVDAYDAAKSVGVYMYKTLYGIDKAVYEQTNYDASTDPSKRFLASIGDSMQVDVGETITKRFKIDATLEYVNQPVCVDTITRTLPAPYAGATGEYVVVGTDDLPILPSEWNDLGGSVTISLTEVPDEIEVTIVAPPVDEMTKVDSGVAFAPYKIGVESAGGVDYPAFWITGTGVFFDKQLKDIGTGAPDAYTTVNEAATIDNPFITSLASLKSRGVAAAQAICGPTVSLTGTIAQGSGFGLDIGSTRRIASNKFRVESVNYSESSTSYTAAACATIADFNEIWADKTFANFTSIALDPLAHTDQAMKFNEFTIIPLMESN